jgi:uncharacterized protein (TIGR02118 family)
VILRSGLIRRAARVQSEQFERHWEGTHGPLTLHVPGLRAYSQNHIVHRHNDHDVERLHRVDGISQLWFDDLDAMASAMASDEQAACNRDLSEFLDRATILIQSPGLLRTGRSAGPSEKHMYLVPATGDDDVEDVASFLEGGGFAFRINHVVQQLSSAILAGVGEPVAAVVEVWGPRDGLNPLRSYARAESYPGFRIREHEFRPVPVRA